MKFPRIANSWALLKASWNVFTSNKKLLIFPVISLIGLFFITATFITAFFLSGIGAQDNTFELIVACALALAFYLINFTVVFYCNTALVCAALVQLRGGVPSVSEAFKLANSHLKSIVGYAVIASTVGVILHAARERGIVGDIITGVLGVAWSLASFLVVPILVVENIGPISALKRSTALLKKSWGENIAGGLAIGLIFGLPSLAIFLSGFYGATHAFQISDALGLTIAAVTFVSLILLHLVYTAITSIYTTALYLYTTGESNKYFSVQLLQQSFKTKIRGI